MKKAIVIKILFTALMLISIIANAQISKRNLITSKYHLADIQKSILSLEEFKPFPTTPTEWKQQVPDSILKNIVAEGVANVNFKFNSLSFKSILAFKRRGNRLAYENESFAKRIALVYLTLAESIENQGHFMDAIMEGVWSICEESYWGLPAHILDTDGIPDVEKPYADLFTAETATTLGLVNYFVGNKLDEVSPLLRKRLILEINRRFFKPVLANIDNKVNYLRDDVKVNNWNPWIMSNYIATNLLIEKDNSKRAEYLYKALMGLDRYLNGLGEDGGCDEGVNYWFAAGGSAYECLELALIGTNGVVNIIDSPLIKSMVSYIYKMHVGSEYFMNIGDGFASMKNLDGIFLYRIGKAINEEQLRQFGIWAYNNLNNKVKIGLGHKFRSVQDLLAIKNIPLTNTYYEAPTHVWISDIQTMAARTKGNLYLGTHAGDNGKSHNHNDVGDFVIYLNNQPFIIDAGRGVYTAKTFNKHRYELWNVQSQYHNLPIINGFGQRDGKAYTSTNVLNIHDEKEDKLTMDIAATYPKEAGIISWKRSNSLMKDKECIIITDEYALDKEPTSIQQILITNAKVDLSEKGKVIFKGDNDNLILEYDDALFSVSVEIPPLDEPEYETFKKESNVIKRVVLTVKHKQQKGKLIYTFKKG